MLRISALNEDDSDDSSGVDEITPPTKEAEEADCLRLYNEALQLRQKKNFDAALNVFHQILSLPLVEKAVKDKGDSDGDEAALSSILQVKYACLKNVGALHNQKKELEDALDAYLEALEVEHNDVTVWYTIGNICMQLKKYQLARHAFEQGLVCSPNHWPCIDGITQALFALGDDVACLFYINKALGKDSMYLTGLVIRDLIFKDTPSFKSDIKSLQPELSWDDLFVKPEFTDEEWKSTSEYALSLRSNTAISPVAQLQHAKQSVRLSAIKSWADLGRALLEIHRKADDECDRMKLSRTLDIELESTAEDSTSPSQKPESHESEDVEMPESDAQTENIQVEKRDADTNIEESVTENVSAPISQQESDAQHVDAPGSKSEPSEKQDNRKRKRSLDQCQQSPSKEMQRRSTRSRAYAQQAEEEIYSLRAELRSYLPTALLFNDEADTKSILENQLQLETTGIVSRPDLDPEAERNGALEFLADIGCLQSTVIEVLRKFCCILATFESYTWSKELSDTYREAYILVRNHACGPEIFNANSSAEGIETLIFCEIFLSFQRTDDPTAETPAWFNQDLAYLFQLADPLISSPSKETFPFQARTFWVHFCWHFQSGQLDEARHYLSMVYNCLYSLNDEKSLEDCVIHSHAFDTFTTFGVSQVNQLMQMLQRTLQLADVTKLHKEKDHKQVVEILKAALKDTKASKQAHAPISRTSQWSMLLESLRFLEEYDEVIVWSERCLNESISEYLQCFTTKPSEGESTEITIDKQQLADCSAIIARVATELDEVLRTKRSSLEALDHNALVRLAENLVLICSHQLESDSSNKLPLNSPIFWVLLHRMIEREEMRSISQKTSSSKEGEGVTAEENPEDDAEGGLPCSTMFLISAHDLLGKRSWCMNQNGIFALYLLEVLVRRRRTTSEVEDREELGRAIEQATFCALGYPTSKKTKSKTFCDHGGATVELTWNIALLVAEYFLPGRQDVPEFDTMKPFSNVDQEIFYKKIVDLIPPELDPRNKVEDIEDFIQGRRSNIPKYLEHSGMPRQMENVFYLLADYYFKNKEWAKAMENYTLDLVLVPDRFDSWAALALATGSRLETKVNSCERMKNAKSFLDRAETALRCFRRALSLRPSHTTLWIEQGSTAYMLHSFCAQLLRNETDSFNIQMFERLEKERERMLGIANGCFLAADKSWLAEVEKGSSVDQDERWLHHYMLGKIAEKRARPFDEYVGCYQKAAQLLEESSAAYPKRISYNTPGHLSVEALEIYYRIHSNCLKVLMTQEGKQIDIELCRTVARQLEIASKGAFASFGKKPEAKQDGCEKETVKRKASKHEEERPSKKSAFDRGETSQLGGRAATIHEVNLILNEILEKVVSSSKLSCFDSNDAVSASDHKPLEASSDNITSATTTSTDATSAASEQKKPSLEPSSGSTSTSDSDDESASSQSPSETVDKKSGSETHNAVPSETAPEPVPDLQSLIETCLTAIKECVGRFPHFYKGVYRLAHYYFHSKTKRNLEACRELLLGRALTPSQALQQQQQGTVQPRYLPVGVGGLFNEWRSNNFFHGIWRIPINEIDRPGCFAYHMGRSVTLLIEVLRETSDHRILMELSLALQPEPEPDKKYLYDSEREQQANLASSLVVQVLRNRLQELKENPSSVKNDGHYSSPQQGSPSSSKKLSLLMDIFRSYDRFERNLPGQGAVFKAILVESYKQFRNAKDTEESQETLVEQALEFCRNKQAQSRARITGTRGGISASGNPTPVRGKRALTGSRRGRMPGITHPSVARESNVPLASTTLASTPPATVPSHSNVMQEAMKLLQSAGGSAENLPPHLKNIPGISNLLALFAKPSAEPQVGPSTAKTESERSEAKKEPSNQKTSASAKSSSSSSTSAPSQTPTIPTSLPSASSASASSIPGFPPGIPNLGFLDPTMLAMLANPYVNPLSMFSGTLLGSDPATISKLQQEYQQQLMNSMQNALAQSYVMSSLTNPFLAGSRSRGRGGKKSVPRTDPSKPTHSDSSKTKTAPATDHSTLGGSSSANAMPMDLSSYGAKLPKPAPKRSSESSQTGSKLGLNRSDAHSRPSTSSLPLDLKLPPPHFEDALKGVKPPPPADSKKSLGSQSEVLKGKSMSSSQSASSLQLPKLPYPSVDVAKFLAELPPSLDLKRLPKTEKRQSLPSTLRAKPDDSKPGPSLTSSIKSSTSTKHTKTPTMPFPINLGKEITLTAASSSKGAFQMPVKQTGKSRPQAMSSMPHLPAGASVSMISGFPHASGSAKHETDPLNLGFSILQNLPSSMSLLVKPSLQLQEKGTIVPRDVAVQKKGRPSEQSAAMPKLTPAPQNSLGGKKGKSVSTSRPPSLHPNSSTPPSFAQSGNPLLLRESPTPKSSSAQINQHPSEKLQKKDINRADVVTID